MEEDIGMEITHNGKITTLLTSVKLYYSWESPLSSRWLEPGKNMLGRGSMFDLKCQDGGKNSVWKLFTKSNDRNKLTNYPVDA